MEEETWYNIAAIGIAILLAFSFFIIYIFFIPDFSHNHNEEYSIITFEVKDGVNKDAEQGCFFTIRAVKAVDIDPTIYHFYVAEQGKSPKALNFDFRDYEDLGENDLTPVGGDRNKSCRIDGKMENMNAEAAGSMWSDGEYIGFDMPMASMGIDIVEGNVYDVMIKDPNMEVVYEGDFIYQE